MYEDRANLLHLVDAVPDQAVGEEPAGALQAQTLTFGRTLSCACNVSEIKEHSAVR
jgi:hypothetical protein